MEEFIINLHMHTTYSDGHGSHQQIAQAALQTGLDGVIVTDHNVWVNGMEGYHQQGERRVLLLIGEEIHDQTRTPQKNHLLVFGANRELATFAARPQQLLDQVQRSGGMAFIAHPYESDLPALGEPDISWVDWDVTGYTGMEIWNGLSEMKFYIRNKAQGLFYALFPQFIARGPAPAALQKWDELLAAGKRIFIVGGADAHALPFSLGPLHRTIFPYEFHFRCINNHLLLDSAPTGDLNNDRRLVLDALRRGSGYVGYDLPASTRGFRFTAHGKDRTVNMGEGIDLNGGVTLQIRLPAKCECRLIKDGKVIKAWHHGDACTYIGNQPGIYRVECYLDYLGRRRGWIFSNPIFING